MKTRPGPLGPRTHRCIVADDCDAVAFDAECGDDAILGVHRQHLTADEGDGIGAAAGREQHEEGEGSGAKSPAATITRRSVGSVHLPRIGEKRP